MTPFIELRAVELAVHRMVLRRNINRQPWVGDRDGLIWFSYATHDDRVGMYGYRPGSYDHCQLEKT